MEMPTTFLILVWTPSFPLQSEGSGAPYTLDVVINYLIEQFMVLYIKKWKGYWKGWNGIFKMLTVHLGHHDGCSDKDLIVSGRLVMEAFHYPRLLA
jgi:hypothetical protein